MTPLIAIGIVSTIAVVAFLIWWLFIHTEGVYLGKGIVIWLYDLYASRYDGIVQRDEVDEHLYLAQPLLTIIAPQTDPLVLDVATGTGRIPLALSQHPAFEGHVIGLDLSIKMLQQAEIAIQNEHFEDFVTFIHADGSQLPFEDASFDVVTCMEALEFMPAPEKALRELVRVLRPDGVLLTTQRINEHLMPFVLWDETTMKSLLIDLGIEKIHFEPWQLDYTLVWGRKQGQSDWIGAQPLEALQIRCTRCASTCNVGHELAICPACGHHQATTQEPWGILDWM